MTLPDLPLEPWENTKITLHLYLQIIGKVKLAMAPRKNHWWHITLLPHPTGLTTGWVPLDSGSFQITMNFVAHQCELTYSSGDISTITLMDGLSVAAFYQKLMDDLKQHGVSPDIIPKPYDHPCKEPFATCDQYHHYDARFVENYHQVLSFVASVFEKFRGKFLGKVSPVQLYWHHMDLAVTRFNGKKGPMPSPESTKADRDAYSHEVISAGFWAGDENVRGAAFYSYTFPSPDGIEKQPLSPGKAQWDMSSGSPMAILMYDDLIKESDPESALIEFLESSYQAGASLGNWPENELIYRAP